jgi:hypothetical protein
MDINTYLQKLIGWSLTNGLQIVFTLILTLVALKAAKMLSTRLITVVIRKKKTRNFRSGPRHSVRSFGMF